MITGLNDGEWVVHDDGKPRSEYRNFGWVARDPHQTFMENVILNVNLKTMQIRNVKKICFSL